MHIRAVYPSGLTPVSVRGEGEPLFLAWALAVNELGGSTTLTSYIFNQITHSKGIFHIMRVYAQDLKRRVALHMWERPYFQAAWLRDYPRSHVQTCPTFAAYLKDLLETSAWGSCLERLACCELTDTRLHVFGQGQHTAYAEGTHILRMLHADKRCSLLVGVPQNEHEYQLTTVKGISTLGRLRLGTVPGCLDARDIRYKISQDTLPTMLHCLGQRDLCAARAAASHMCNTASAYFTAPLPDGISIASEMHTTQRTILQVWAKAFPVSLVTADVAHHKLICHFEAGWEYYRAMWNGRHRHQAGRTCPTFSQYLRLQSIGPVGGGVLEHLAFCHITDTTLHIFTPQRRAPTVINQGESQLVRMIAKRNECVPLYGEPHIPYLVDYSIDIFGWGPHLGTAYNYPYVSIIDARNCERVLSFTEYDRNKYSRNAGGLIMVPRTTPN